MALRRFTRWTLVATLPLLFPLWPLTATGQEPGRMVVPRSCLDTLAQDTPHRCRIVYEHWMVTASAPRILSDARRLLHAAGFTFAVEESTATRVRLITADHVPERYCDLRGKLTRPTAAVLVAAQARRRKTEVLVVVDGTGVPDSTDGSPAFRAAFCTIGTVVALLDSSLTANPP